MKLPFLLFSFCMFASLLCAGEPVSFEEFTASGEIQKTPEGFVTPAAKKVTLEASVPPERPVIRFRCRVGKGNGGAIQIEIRDEEGRTGSLSLRSQDYKDNDTVYPDAMLQMNWKGGGTGWNIWYFRPNPKFYHPKAWETRRNDWGQLPSAVESSLTVEMRPAGKSTEVWIEGLFMWEFEVGPIASYHITLNPGSRLEFLQFEPFEASDVLSLPVGKHTRTGVFDEAELNFDKAAKLPSAFRGMTKAAGINVDGLGEFNGWQTDDLQNFFWRRSALYNLPEQRMFTAPLATYSHAWVLAALDPGKEDANTFTLRVTRYGNSRGNAMADTTVTVPRGENAKSPDARRVGTVTTAQGKKVPLWLIRVPIYNGLIQDLIYDDTKRGGMPTHRYLDVELLAPLANADTSRAFPPPMEARHRQWKPLDRNYKGYDFYDLLPFPMESGVTVFGIALEQSPAELQVRTNPEMKAFYESDKAEFIAEVRARKAGKYTVEWSVADVDGKVVHSAKETLKLDAGASGEARLRMKPDNGWFAVRARLLGVDGVELVDKQSSYVMLPPDTRKAGYESPYYGWCFGNNHGSPVTLEQFGPLLQRLGVRRAELSEEFPESLTKKYGFTGSTISWRGGRDALRDFATGKASLEEAVAMQEADIRKHVELWPAIDRMLVFHESGASSAPFPTEMWGEPAKNFAQIQDENSPQALLDREGGGAAAAAAAAPAESETKAREAWGRSWPKRIQYLTAMAKMVREKFPQIKMQYGNDGNSLGIVGELFRQKFPRELIDTVAIEDLGQTFTPENLSIGGLHSAWYLREITRKMGYEDVPVTACTEWIGRMTEKLGLRAQAEWKVRDTLLGLAYGFDTLSVAGLNDAGDGYYYSIWANGGLTGRWPEMAPKPAYAGIATLTQVLDQAKFERWVPTGSTVFYAQEFKRGDEWVYTFWTPRGTREATVEFGNDAKRRLIDLYGREKEVTGKTVKFQAGTAVHYLVSKDPVKSIHAGQRKSYRKFPWIR